MKGKTIRARSLLGARAEKLILKFQRTANEVHHSLGVFGSGLASAVQKMEADIIHLHWVNNCCLSLRDIRLLAAAGPLVWTLHDMWAFCGAEHYVGSYDDHRYELGYTGTARPRGERGLPLNQWAWNRKRRFLPSNIIYIAPSRWLAEIASRSVVLHGRRIEVIPNGLDTDFWSPASKLEAREALGIAPSEKLLLYSVAAGFREWRKGGDLLESVLGLLPSLYAGKVVAATMGETVGPERKSERFRAIGTGFLRNSSDVRRWFRAADVVIVPSRLDNFPNVALEAMACGTPCCGFDSGGLREAVIDGQNGYIVGREDVAGLAAAIARLIGDDAQWKAFGNASRDRAVANYSLSQLADAHIRLYDGLCAHRRPNPTSA